MPKDLPATIPARLDRQVATVGTQATTARPAAIASRTNQLRPERIRSSSTRRRHTRKGGEKQGLTWFARQLVSGKVEEISRKTLRVPLAGHADGPIAGSLVTRIYPLATLSGRLGGSHLLLLRSACAALLPYVLTSGPAPRCVVISHEHDQRTRGSSHEGDAHLRAPPTRTRASREASER
jgi:hypothetical protein